MPAIHTHQPRGVLEVIPRHSKIPHPTAEQIEANLSLAAQILTTAALLV